MFVLEFTRVEAPQDAYSFRFERQDYTLRTAGGGRRRFTIAWDAALLADLAAIQGPGGDAAVRRVGERLRDVLDPVGWDGLGTEIRRASEAGRRVVLTIRANAAELYALPWELLVTGASTLHVGALPGVVVRHEWPETHTTAEAITPRPAGSRILFAWSAVGSVVPAADHVRAIAAACSDGNVAFAGDRDALEHVSLVTLADRLARARADGEPFVALHLLCHGGRSGSSFGVVLDDPGGAACVVDGGRLAQVLSPFAGTLRLVVLAACEGGDSGDPGSLLPGVGQALHRAGIQTVIASRYRLSLAGSTTLTRTLYRALLVDLDSLEGAFIQARTRLAAEASHLDWASLQLYARTADGEDTRPFVFRPYRGLLAFEARHRRFFFGRAAERQAILDRLQAAIDGGQPRLVVVAGASGTGKSSLVLAGVRPDIERVQSPRPGRWHVVDVRPGGEPLAALERALSGHTDASGPWLVIVDQFEEIFTHTESAATREAFARRLWALARGTGGVAVVLTVRVDFLERCGEVRLDEGGTRLDRIAYREATTVFVPRMDPGEVREAITGPLALVGLHFDPGLEEQLLRDVGTEPGAMPLLQHALDHLWLYRSGRALSVRVYQASDGLAGPLQSDADALLGQLDAAQKQQARRLLTRLVRPSGEEGQETRRRVELWRFTLPDPRAQAVFDEVVALLVEKRLVVRTQPDGESPTVEVAHEALIRRWQQLREWLAEDRTKLIDLDSFAGWVNQWKRHRTFLSGVQLEKARALVRAYPDDVDSEMRELARRSATRRLIWRGLLTGLVVLVVAAGVVATVFWRAERQSAEAARAHARDARDVSRLGIARGAVDGRPTLALMLLREVETRDPAQSLRGWSLTASEALAGNGQEIAVLREHTDVVRYADISPDGGKIVTASSDRTARVWDATTGAVLAVLRGHEGPVNRAVFSPDGTRVVTASADGSARVWDPASGAPLAVFGDHTEEVFEANFSPDGALVVSASRDKTARVSDATTGTQVMILGHADLVHQAAFSADGTRVMTMGSNDRASIWDARTGELRFVLPRDWGSDPVFSRDGKRLLVHLDGVAHVYDTDTDTGEVARLGRRDQRIEGADLSPDGKFVVTVQRGGAAQVWSVETGNGLQSLHPRQASVRSAAFGPDRRRVWTSSSDSTIRVWDAWSGAVLATLPHGVEDRIIHATLSRDGTRIVTTAYALTTRLWSMRPSAELLVLRSPTKETIAAIGFGTGGIRLLSTSNGPARVWGEQGERRIGHEGGVRASAFDRSGTRLVTASSDRTARVWNADTGAEVAHLVGHEDPKDERKTDYRASIHAASFNPDGTRVMTVADDRTARIWDATTGKQIAVLRHEAKPDDAAFSLDGARVVTAHRNDALVWDAQTGEMLAICRGHGHPVTSAVFSPDGAQILTGSRDRSARLWDASTCSARRIFSGHVDPIDTVRISPDGRHVLTQSHSTARLWSARTGDEEAVFRHTMGIRAIAFTHDGRRIVTVASDEMGVWDVATGAALTVRRGGSLFGHLAAFSLDGDRVATVDGNTVRVWPTVPSREQLWRASPLCLTADEYSLILGLNPHEANAAADRCTTMVGCLRRKRQTAASFDACFAAFTASLAGTPSEREDSR